MSVVPRALKRNTKFKRRKKKTQLVRADLLRGERAGERETALERGAGVCERGAVDVREDGELEAELGGREFDEGWDRVGEDGPVGEGHREGGCGIRVRSSTAGHGSGG